MYSTTAAHCRHTKKSTDEKPPGAAALRGRKNSQVPELHFGFVTLHCDQGANDPPIALCGQLTFLAR